jgi:hypothetical protein
MRKFKLGLKFGNSKIISKVNIEVILNGQRCRAFKKAGRWPIYDGKYYTSEIYLQELFILRAKPLIVKMDKLMFYFHRSF